jgi:hypothetical protein
MPVKRPSKVAQQIQADLERINQSADPTTIIVELIKQGFYGFPTLDKIHNIKSSGAAGEGDD